MWAIAAISKMQDLRDIFAATPFDALLATDSPYLAPPPLAGKRNEPAYTAHTARVGPRCSASTTPISRGRRQKTSTGCSEGRGLGQTALTPWRN